MDQNEENIIEFSASTEGGLEESLSKINQRLEVQKEKLKNLRDLLSEILEFNLSILENSLFAAPGIEKEKSIGLMVEKIEEDIDLTEKVISRLEDLEKRLGDSINDLKKLDSKLIEILKQYRSEGGK